MRTTRCSQRVAPNANGHAAPAGRLPRREDNDHQVHEAHEARKDGEEHVRTLQKLWVPDQAAAAEDVVVIVAS